MPLNTSAGNTLATATSLNLTPLNPIQVSGSNVNVNTSAPDFYAIRFSGRSSLNLSLTCLTPPTGNGSNSNINVEVLASNGTTLVQKSENGGSLSESVNLLDQAAGLYYIRVYTASATSADYSLNLSTRNLVRSDLVWRNYSSGVADSGKTSLWTMNGTTRTQGQEVLPRVADASWRVETTGDFNSDGQADLVWRNYSSNSPDSGKTSIWLMNGTNRVQGQEVLPRVSDLSWQVVGTGDFNSDGKTDLVWRNYSTGLADSGKTSVWFMDGTTRVQGQEVQPTARVTDTNWRIDAVGDFNNDGQSDLVWRNYSTGLADSGKTTVWFMNGTTRVQGQEVQPSARVTDTNWQIVGAGDFNGDGQADLVWRNYSSNSPDSGKTTVWIMNGTTRVQEQEVQPSARVTDLNWQVVGVSARYDVPPRSDIDGNSLPTAFNIGTLNGSGIYRGALNSSDTVDFYQFNLLANSSFNLLLNGLSADGNVSLYDRNGNLIQHSDQAGTLAESINISDLAAGTYSIKVNLSGNGSTHYGLNVSNTSTAFPTVDLLGTSFSTLQKSLNAGSSFDVNFQVRNTGTGDTNGFRVAFYLSSDATIATSDRLLGSCDINQLTANTTSNILTSHFVLPNDSDPFWSSSQPYYIGMVVDTADAIAEMNEGNNANTGLLVDCDRVQITVPPPPSAIISQLSFSGNEGDAGTFQIQLNRAPTANVTLTLNAGNFLTVDADGVISTGTQNAITFTPNDWNQPHTVRFIAEQDNLGVNRTSGNTINYTLSGGQTGTGSYDLGTILNTYTPDPSRYNIDLDFRNDYLGFWTPSRRAIVQQAANDWANLIANELGGFTLTNQSLRQFGVNGQTAFNFTTNRFVDDLVVFVGAYTVDSNGGWGAPTMGTSANDPLPRVGTIALNSSNLLVDQESDLTTTFDLVDAGLRTGAQILYTLASHEIGHVLGLMGFNFTSRQAISNGGFTGAYSKAYNGGSNVLLGSSGHPDNHVVSIMSYGTEYGLSAPSEMDKRFLADSGYQVHGINASGNSPLPQVTQTLIPTPQVAGSNLVAQAANAQPISLPGCGCILCRLSANVRRNLAATKLTDLVKTS